MSLKRNSDKKDWAGIALLTAEQNSHDKKSAEEFLQSNGIDTAKFVMNGLKKIKQAQLLINAGRTDQAMRAAEQVKEQAAAWVDKMLGSLNFSLPELVEAEQLSMSFKNMETLSKEDIRAILIKHFTLKFIDRQNKGTS